VITAEQMAEFRARIRAAIDALPAPGPERLARIGQMYAEQRLRRARTEAARDRGRQADGAERER
jgi:hypothetical protein